MFERARTTDQLLNKVQKLERDYAWLWSRIHNGAGGVPTFTDKSIPFSANTGILTENNSAFTWDDSIKRLGVVGSISVNTLTEQPFIITERNVGLAFPVPTLLPSGNNKNMAFDLMPKGSPGDFSDNGICWFDICDTECLSTNPPLNAARMGISSTAVQFGSRSFNGASAKPVQFVIGTTSLITLNTNNTSTFNIGKITQSQSISGDYVGYTMLNTNNAVSESNPIFFIGQDIASSRFGYIRWNNAATSVSGRLANSLEIISNAGGTNGIQIGTAGSTAPIRFTQTNGFSTHTERMRIDGVGSVGIGASTINASALLQIDSTTKGVLLPRVTTTQKNSIASPAEGLLVYDTTLHKLCVYTGSAWETITSA